MRPTEKFQFKFFPVLFILLICININVLVGQINQPRRIEFPEESVQKAIDFCITEDSLLMIPDEQAGNIKIYERKEKLECIDTIGWKGVGPGEFLEPTYCFYNIRKGKFGVLDFGRRKIYIYDRITKIGRTEFKLNKEIYCLPGGTDIKLSGDELLIAGYKPDPNGEPYDLYSININNDQPTFLLRSYYKYGLNSFEEYEREYRNKPDIKMIGIDSWFDIQGDDIYFVWEGDLRIIKININSRELTFFGIKTSHYKKPYVSNKMREGFVNMDRDTILRERARMSYVRGIFTSPEYVFVIYEGPVSTGSNFRLQFYTLTGEFVKEVPIPGHPTNLKMRMRVENNRNILYSIPTETNEEEDPGKYFVLEYEIPR